MIPNPASMGDSGKPLGAYPWTPALYILTHIALDAASFVQPVLKLGITPMSPQTGLAVAFLISRRKGFWWVVLALLVAGIAWFAVNPT